MKVLLLNSPVWSRSFMMDFVCLLLIIVILVWVIGNAASFASWIINKIKRKKQD